MNPMWAMKKGTAMKDKKKRAGGGSPPPSGGTYPESFDNGLGIQDNVFGVAGINYTSIQSGLSCASMTITQIVDGNSGANIAPYTGTDLEIVDYLATVAQGHIPSGFPPSVSLIPGEVTLNIANNNSVTILNVGMSVYNTINARFGNSGHAADLSIFHDAQNLVGQGHVFVAGFAGVTLLNGNHDMVAATLGGAIGIDNPPPVASGELIFQLQWRRISSKRGGGDHETDRAANPTSQFTGSAYFGVVIT